jgi:hypothetical protein
MFIRGVVSYIEIAEAGILFVVVKYVQFEMFYLAFLIGIVAPLY